MVQVNIKRPNHHFWEASHVKRHSKVGASVENVSKGGARVENPHFSGALKWRAPLKVAPSPKSSSKDGA